MSKLIPSKRTSQHGMMEMKYLINLYKLEVLNTLVPRTSSMVYKDCQKRDKPNKFASELGVRQFTVKAVYKKEGDRLRIYCTVNRWQKRTKHLWARDL
jgi:hypothetical protein